MLSTQVRSKMNRQHLREVSVNRCRAGFGPGLIGEKSIHQSGKMPSTFASFWWFDRQNLVLGYLLRRTCSIWSYTRAPGRRLDGIYIYICIHTYNRYMIYVYAIYIYIYVYIFSGMVSRWLAACELTVLWFVLSSSLAVAIEPQVCCCDNKETAIAPCRTVAIWRDRRERRELEVVGNWLVGFGFWRSTWKKVKHHVVLFAKQVFHDMGDKLKEGWWRVLHVSTLLSWNFLTMESYIVNYQSDTLQYLEMQSLHVCLQSLECNVIFHKGAVWFQFFPFLLWASGMPKAIPQAIPKRGVQRWRGSAWIFLISGM